MTTTAPSVFERILDPASRADPYPLYARLREHPVLRQDDGSYVVSTYREIVDLLHDPRLSSDHRNIDHTPDEPPRLPPPFISTDPPEHDRLRRMVMCHFGPPHTPDRVDGMVPRLHGGVSRLIDDLAGRTEIDIVDQVAYPFPVSVICELLGVPREDEPCFHGWVESIVETIDPSANQPDARHAQRAAKMEMAQYFAGLINAHRDSPGDDLLSALATDDGPDGRMTDVQLLTTAFLLLVARHETTVNLIANGMLTLLRHPRVLERLRTEPPLAIHLTEELLRYEPPVQLIPRRAALDDIEIAGTVIPKGSRVVLVLASGSHDPTTSEIPTGSIPTGSASPATPTSTSASAVASTTASAHPWRGWRPRAHWPYRPAGWCTHGW